MGRRGPIVLAAAVLLGCAAAPTGEPATPPQAALIVLAPSDFGGGTQLARQESAPVTGLGLGVVRSSAYTRIFANADFDNTAFASVVSSAIVAKRATDAASFMRSVTAILSTPSERKAVLGEAEQSFAASTKSQVKSGKFVRGRILHLPDETVQFEFEFTLATGSLLLGEFWTLKGPVVAETVFITRSTVGEGPVLRLARAVEAHLTIATATAPPVNSVPPTVTGVVAVGKTLGVNRGTWSNPAEFGVQWLRCSASTSQCTAIGGQTGPTYTVSSADIGSTLSVDVTGRNGAGTTAVDSVPTAVVSQ